jgi:hypothetical protein
MWAGFLLHGKNTVRRYICGTYIEVPDEAHCPLAATAKATLIFEYASQLMNTHSPGIGRLIHLSFFH